MNAFAGLLSVLLVFPAACLAGYAVAGALVSLTAGVRMCLAALAGLGIWLWLVATVNIFLPINFLVAWAILGSGWLVTLFLPYARRALAADLREIFSTPGWGWVMFAPLPLIIGLLLPMLLHPGLVFYDGTSNHDSFFWITGAEWVQQHTYLASPNRETDPAYYAITRAFTGTSPVWARMGTEGLLALFASAFRVLPIESYLYAQVGLLTLWIASVVIFFRLILAQRLSVWVFCVGASLQPIFVFFATNNNLPNLLAALVAPVMLVAFVRLTEPTKTARLERIGWGALVAFMLHGMLCTYPEMASFALFAAGTAVVAKLCRSDRQACRFRLVGGVLLAGTVGLLIQPLTTWRLYSGLLNSFHQARADSRWGNLFAPLDIGAYFPALTTLNIPACKSFGPGLSWALTVLLAFLLIMVVRRAYDRATAMAGLSGSILLIAYTLLTGFSYGWQKTAQFSGVILAAIFTLGSYSALAPAPGLRHPVFRFAGLVALAGLMAYTTIWGCARSFYWSEIKALDVSFLSLRELSRLELRDRPVEVVGATFGRAFFYSMWAEYALPYSRLTFDPRGEQMGGYLAEYLPHYDTRADSGETPRAYLISRAWADTFDAGSLRLSTGEHHALVAQTNKMVSQTGVFPVDGVPQNARAQFSLTLLPYADGVLEMDIVPQSKDQQRPQSLTISYGDPDRTDTWQTIRFEYPWSVRLPVRAGGQWEIKVESTITSAEAYPLHLSKLRLVRH